MGIEIARFCLKGNTKVLLSKSDGKRIIAGYANVAIVDLENQYIPLSVLQKGIQTLLADSSYANLMIMHKNIQIGKIIESYGKYKTGVDDKGLFIVCEIRKDIKVADEIWSAILQKQISGFSIGCEVLLSHKVCDDKECVTVLDKINIFEVSVCTEPVNQKSGFVVIAKSDFEKFQTDVNVLNVNNNGSIMTDEIKKEETKCNDCTEPLVELSVEERLEALEVLSKKINEFMILAQKKPEEEKVPPETGCKEEKKAEIPIPVPEIKAEPEKPPFPPIPVEQPVADPEEEKPEEMDMAIFMLDYIIRNPKSTAQDIAKAWMKKSQKAKLSAPESIPVQETVKQDLTMESLMKKVDTLSEKISKLDYTEELKSSLKVRDDAIQALEKKIEIINKSKEPEKKQEPVPETKQEIKTVQAKSEPVFEKEPLIRVSQGIVTSSEFM